MIHISVVSGDILLRPSNLLVLKHADGFHGVDAAVAKRLRFSETVANGGSKVVPGRGTKADQVLFIGVGPLGQFRYEQIRRFARQCLKTAAGLETPPKVITMPVHGVNYGLDENEAFLSLVGGLTDALTNLDYPVVLQRIEIVELNSQRATRLRSLLATALQVKPARSVGVRTTSSPTSRATRKARTPSVKLRPRVQEELSHYGKASEKKVRMFVAMPFKDEYVDEFDVAITDAARHTKIICERIDKTSYVGDIMANLKKRIESYNGMIALLNDANPNVFLEIGYAWAKDKPTVLLVSEREKKKMPFDVAGQKCIVYPNIAALRDKLKAELTTLKKDGVLKGRR